MIEEIKQKGARTWINCVSPTLEEIQHLNQRHDLPSEFITAVQDADEIPFIERNKDRWFALIKIPIKTGDSTLPFRTVPLGIVMLSHQFITICFQENEVVKRFKPEGKGLASVLRILFASARTYLAYLKEINREIQSTEKDLEHVTRNEDLFELFVLQKSLIYFSTAVNANINIIERLSRMISTQEKELFDDVVQEYKQASALTKIYSVVLNVTTQTFTSIISNNVSRVMKTLTAVTIILMIPTLIASVYGMNVHLPFESSPYAFLIVIALSTLLTLFGTLIFWRKALF